MLCCTSRGEGRQGGKHKETCRRVISPGRARGAAPVRLGGAVVLVGLDRLGMRVWNPCAIWHCTVVMMVSAYARTQASGGHEQRKHRPRTQGCPSRPSRQERWLAASWRPISSCNAATTNASSCSSHRPRLAFALECRIHIRHRATEVYASVPESRTSVQRTCIA